MKPLILIFSIMMQVSFSQAFFSQRIQTGQVIEEENPVIQKRNIVCNYDKYKSVRQETAPGNFDYIATNLLSVGEPIILEEVKTDDPVPVGTVSYVKKLSKAFEFKFHFYKKDGVDFVETVSNLNGGAVIGAVRYEKKGQLLMDSMLRVAGTNPVLMGHYYCREITE